MAKKRKTKKHFAEKYLKKARKANKKILAMIGL